MATGLRPTADVSAPDAAEVTAKAARENFPVALLVLPRPDARATSLAVYGFARLVDDAGDEAPGDRARPPGRAAHRSRPRLLGGSRSTR